MNLDIQPILEAWSYEPGQLNVRKIRGRDKRDKIQLRLDLGLLQMEVSGRPDGQKPFGHESLLHYYEHRLRHHQREHGSDEGFALDAKTCELLRSEGRMYYHRYLASFVLEEYERVRDDTARNLRLFDFCRTYAADEADRLAQEAYRPYVLMMNARARVHLALNHNQPRKAMRLIEDGVAAIRRHFEDLGQEEAAQASRELQMLLEMREEIGEQVPVDPIEHLEQQLAEAVREERYEDAAKLRDRLRGFEIRRPEGPGGHPGTPGSPSDD